MRTNWTVPFGPSLTALLMMLASVGGCSQLSDAATAPRGALVIVGGGGTPDEVVRRAIALAGGADAAIVVLPQASQRAAAGEESAAMFREAGATNVRVLALDATSVNDDRARLDAAKLIWFPGGDQNRLMQRLNEAGLVEAIRKIYEAGAVVGGTSAGAAVMGAVMIKGGAELGAVRRGGTPVDTGLGLWPQAIVDQHFHRRQRFIRLLSAVLERPEKIGVGIDERTAVILHDGRAEVMGESSVLVIDARKAKRSAPTETPGGLLSAKDVELHLLTACESIEAED